MTQFYIRHSWDREITRQIKDLYRLDNYHAILSIASDYIIICAAIWVTFLTNWLMYPIAIVLIGSRQRALATMMHEASHGTLTRSRRLAFLLATVFSGYLVFSTFVAYKNSHVFRHHGKFGDRKQDDDYKYMLEKGVYSIVVAHKYVFMIFIRPLLLIDVPSYLIYLVKNRLFYSTTKSRIELVAFTAYWCAILGCVIRFDLIVQLTLFWFVPFLTSFQVIGWFIELAEHAPLMESGVDILMTRNRNSHWMEKMLTGMHGESYHLAHHLWPRVPFWRLKELHWILLADADYASVDARTGGIFFSSNGAPPVVVELMDYVRRKELQTKVGVSKV